MTDGRWLRTNEAYGVSPRDYRTTAASPITATSVAPSDASRAGVPLDSARPEPVNTRVHLRAGVRRRRRAQTARGVSPRACA
jgi:hypothetical protein